MFQFLQNASNGTNVAAQNSSNPNESSSHASELACSNPFGFANNSIAAAALNQLNQHLMQKHHQQSMLHSSSSSLAGSKLLCKNNVAQNHENEHENTNSLNIVIDDEENELETGDLDNEEEEEEDYGTDEIEEGDTEEMEDNEEEEEVDGEDEDEEEDNHRGKKNYGVKAVKTKPTNAGTTTTSLIQTGSTTIKIEQNEKMIKKNKVIVYF
jgi:hypothetical protein